MSATAPSAAPAMPATVLSADDRCDRCGSQAYLRVELATGAELLFCGHHAHEYGPKLSQLAVAVHDERDTLARLSSR